MQTSFVTGGGLGENERFTMHKQGRMTDGTNKIDPWQIPVEKSSLSPAETLFLHSEKPVPQLLDEARQAGRSVSKANVPLNPQRRLLHEVIVEMATTRDFADEREFQATVKSVVGSAEYQDALQGVTHDNVHNRGASLAYNFSEANGLKPLETFSPADRRVSMMMGGVASGKTTLRDAIVEDMRERGQSPGVVVDADAYKPLLANPAEIGAGHANLTSKESNLIAEKITARLEAQLAKDGNAPNVVLDRTVVTAEDVARQKSGAAQVEIHATNCPVDDAVERMGVRGDQTGRYVPTKVVLETHKKVANATAEVLGAEGAVVKLYDSDVPEGEPFKLMASRSKDGVIVVHDAPKFGAYMNQGQINTKAGSPDEVMAGAKPKPLADQLEALAAKAPDAEIRIRQPGTDVTIAELTGGKAIIHDETAMKAMVGDEGLTKLVNPATKQGTITTKGATHDGQTGRQHAAEPDGVGQSLQARQGEVSGRSAEPAAGTGRSGHDSGRYVEGVARGTAPEAPSGGTGRSTPIVDVRGGDGGVNESHTRTGNGSVADGAGDVKSAARRAMESMEHLDAGGAVDASPGNLKPAIPKPNGAGKSLGDAFKRAVRKL